MKKYIVVSAVGKDRPGFVNGITHAIRELGGNIELQRSTRMANEYALIFLFTVDAAQVKAAIDRLAALKFPDTFITAREAVSADTPGQDRAGVAELTASGADQPGIIDAVTHVLFQDNVNIESMDYDTESAPMTGEYLFRMTARLAIPKGVDVNKLREKLRAMERDYNFDVILRYPVE
jgi:glycine cleavage system transcriptional repressor